MVMLLRDLRRTSFRGRRPTLRAQEHAPRRETNTLPTAGQSPDSHARRATPGCSSPAARRQASRRTFPANAVKSKRPTSNGSVWMCVVRPTAASAPTTTPSKCDLRALPDEHPAYGFRFGAQGHSQANLLRALRRAVREHAVQTHRAEEEREARGNADHEHREREPRHGVRGQTLHGENAIRRRFGNHLADDLANFRFQLVGLASISGRTPVTATRQADTPSAPGICAGGRPPGRSPPRR